MKYLGQNIITIGLIIIRILLQVYSELSVCLLDTTEDSAKTAKPTKVPFGLETRVVPLNNVDLLVG